MDVLAAVGVGLGVGFMGSVHCVGMCGGIAAALSSAGTAAGASPVRRGALSFAYSAGRVSGYALAGALVGALGLWLADLVGPYGAGALRALAALLIVSVGLYMAGWRSPIAWIERRGLGVWRRIAPHAARLKPGTSISGALALGMLWGWIPCGLVYSALALAAAAGDPLTGAVLMTAFGLGTVPAVVATGLSADAFTSALRRPARRRLAGALVVVFGLWTLVGSVAALPDGETGAGPQCHETAEDSE